jgi:outer membrane lipoprotein-sorting protein
MVKFRYLLILSTFFLSQFSFFAYAQGSEKKYTEKDGKIALKLITEKYKKLGSWGAEFSQETVSVGLGKSGRFSLGQFVFVFPDKFKFLVGAPENSDFVSDGKEAWFIQKRKTLSKESVLVRHFRNVTQVELSKYLVFLRGQENALKDYKVTGLIGEETIELELKPKVMTDISRIVLFFGQTSAAPQKIVLEDAVSTKTVLTLNSHRKLSDEEVKNSKFKPEIPPNAKIEEL